MRKSALRYSLRASSFAARGAPRNKKDQGQGVRRRCGAGRASTALMDTRAHQGDALPTTADVYPPSKPIFSFYPRSADRTRTFPRGKELDYFDKTYSDGCVAAAGRVRTCTYTFACT